MGIKPENGCKWSGIYESSLCITKFYNVFIVSLLSVQNYSCLMSKIKMFNVPVLNLKRSMGKTSL